MKPRLVALALVLVACNDATDHEIERVIGRIDPGNSSVQALVVAPEVQASVPFTVIVHTFGTSDCTTPDGESVEISDTLVRIVPYDVVPIPGHSDVCQHDNTSHQHRTSVTLARAGVVRVRLVGMSAASADPVLDSVEALVTVAP